MATINFTFLLLAMLGIALASPTITTRQNEVSLDNFKPRPNSDPGCVAWIEAIEDDNCLSLYHAAGISNSIDEFRSWNPDINLDCSFVIPGYWYCVSAPPPPPSVSRAPPSKVRRSPQSKPSDFPPSPPQLKCIEMSTTTPKVGSGGLFNVAAAACNIIVGTDGRFLEKGDPYNAYLSTEGKTINVAVQIKKGGFTLSRLECERWLGYVIYGCDSSGKNMGGCMYSADYNLESCIFILH